MFGGSNAAKATTKMMLSLDVIVNVTTISELTIIY